MKKGKRGFASMDPARQREIASMGGKAAQREGRAHAWKKGTKAPREALKARGGKWARAVEGIHEVAGDGVVGD